VALGIVEKKIDFPPPNAIKDGRMELDAELPVLLPKIVCRI
jgi:hypothetical protein